MIIKKIILGQNVPASLKCCLTHLDILYIYRIVINNTNSKKNNLDGFNINKNWFKKILKQFKINLNVKRTIVGLISLPLHANMQTHTCECFVEEIGCQQDCIDTWSEW